MTSTRYYKNHYQGLPDTKVILYHSLNLDPTELDACGVFRSLVRESKHVLVTDTTVANIYLDRMVKCLAAMSLQVCPVTTTPGDYNKCLQSYTVLLDHCGRCGIDRESSVISFGGGVVKELAGFLASTLFRGLNLVHVPTTLLAQVDAAVDCNQSLNLPIGKNLVGTWYSPAEVWVNPAFLRSLGDRWVRDGLSESIKIALCLSSEFLEVLSRPAISDQRWLSQIIDRSISLKIETLRGESEAEEAAKQYGHTVGHAIEHLSGGTIGHGAGIAIGMCVSAEMALLAGFSDLATLHIHYSIFSNLDLPTKIPFEQEVSQVMTQIRHDKHFVRGQLYAPVLRSIGKFAANNEGRIMMAFPEAMVLRSLEENKNRSGTRMLASKL